MAQDKRKPICLSMLICDDVYRDIATQKQVIVGTFNTIRPTALPYVHPRMVVLFSLTDAKGSFDLKISIEHEKSGQRLIEIGGPLSIDDPLMVHDFDLILNGATFRDPGKHWVILEANGEVLNQRPMMVMEHGKG